MRRFKLIADIDNDFTSAERMTARLKELARALPGLDVVEVHSAAERDRELPTAHLVVTWTFPAELYAKGPSLVAVLTPSAGRERVAADPSGTVRTFYGGFHGILMAETLLALILYFNRQLWRAVENQRSRGWERAFFFEAPRLAREHVVIIGFGRIGRHCARVLKPLGPRITGVRRSGADPVLDRDADEVVTFEEVSPRLKTADHVVCVLPSDTGTDRIFTRDHFRSMKKSAIFYNLGRGNCCAEDDLVWALESGTIKGAGLDVFEKEPLPASSRLWGFPNVLILPHASPLYPDFMDLFFEELRERLASIVPA